MGISAFEDGGEDAEGGVEAVVGDVGVQDGGRGRWRE